MEAGEVEVGASIARRELGFGERERIGSEVERR
jgi:hypothetical protein